MNGVRDSNESDVGFVAVDSGSGRRLIGSRSSSLSPATLAGGSDGRKLETGGPAGSGSSWATPPPVGSNATQP